MRTQLEQKVWQMLFDRMPNNQKSLAIAVRNTLQRKENERLEKQWKAQEKIRKAAQSMLILDEVTDA